jgi:hypothetical protein
MDESNWTNDEHRGDASQYITWRYVKKNQLTVDILHFPVGSDYRAMAHICARDKQLY